MLKSSEPLMAKYLHQRGVENGIPVSGNFELTSRCNFNCAMCYVHDNRPDGVTCRQWIELGKQAKDAGTLFLLLTGGEPLIREDFEEIYSELIELGFMISVNTNGSLINNYLSLFKKKPPFRVNVSLYGADGETYGRLCKSDRFHDVTDGIISLREFGVPVRLNAVFTSHNIDSVEGVIDISKQLGVQIKTTAYSYPPVRLRASFGENVARLSAQEAGRCTVRCDRYRFSEEAFKSRTRQILSGEHKPHPICEDGEHIGCRAGRASFWITSEGVMLPCGMMSTPESYPLRDGFLQAWEEIKSMTAKIVLPHECTVCTVREACNICAAMCYSETGRFDKKPEYVCTMVHSILSSLKEE